MPPVPPSQSTDSSNLPVSIEQEIRSSYLDYAMSVIMSRALPDSRDGLKPVHRRILYSMYELGNTHSRAYKKSARIVGDVIGKYHPHGDTAIYDALVRMAQPFSLRHMLVEGQGNFGSIDGDTAAAMRYTEVRLQKISDYLLSDLDKDTVNYVPNYDGSERIPSVLPTRFPNLLVNGSHGIAVGMATNIPPHNLEEIMKATLHRLKNPSCSLDELLEFVPAPDFPTGGIIYGTSDLRSAYATGRGRVVIRARYHIENTRSGDRESVIITEIPYQIIKSRLIERIAELVKEKKVEGISEIRDESSKEGIRVVLEMKRGESGDVLMNQLYLQTPLQSSFGINIVAIENDRPQQMGLVHLLDTFLNHRREVISRRSLFELQKSKQQTHLLEGLGIAMYNVDPIIECIQNSKDAPEAKATLMNTPWQAGEVAGMVKLLENHEYAAQTRVHILEGQGLMPDGTYKLSEAQAQAILELRLQRLTSLEREKLFDDYREQLAHIKDLLEILTDPARLEAVMEEEFLEIIEKFADPRRSTIEHNAEEVSALDLITEEQVVVTMTQDGYIKASSLESFRSQNRGGQGKLGAALKEADLIRKLLVSSNHNTLLCFTNRGRVHWLDVYKIPMGSTAATRGRPLVNLIQLDEGESVTEILPLTREQRESASESDEFIFFSTSQGTVKRSPLSEFSKPRKLGLIAISLHDEDTLRGVSLVRESDEILLFSSAGRATRFKVGDVRSMGRTAAGVRGIRLDKGQRLVRMLAVKSEEAALVLTVCENGYGKSSPLSEFPLINRGGKGVIAIRTSERNGELISADIIRDEKEFMLISEGSLLIRTPLSSVPNQSRATQGVRLIHLKPSDRLVDVALIAPEEGDQSQLPAL